MNALAAALFTKPEYIVTLDFETYYADDYTLSKMTTADYVRDPRFQTIGCGVKIKRLADGYASKASWLTPEEFTKFVATMDWSKCAVLAHHTHFDGLIAAHHYGIKPLLWLDTLSMARALHGTEVGGSLSKLMAAYGVGQKGTYVSNAKGKRREDFTPAEYAAYGEYCCTDVEGCWALFNAMLPKLPETQLWSIDTTIRMFTEPTLVVNEKRLTAYLEYERRRKQELLDRVAKDKEVLLSNEKFAALLIEMGIDPPRKVSPRTGKETWAFAKTDPGMQDLLEHDRDDIRWLAEARVGVKSTINETRTERLLRAGQGGRRVPIYLKSNGAHTFRWAGGDKMNAQNWERARAFDPKRCEVVDHFGTQCASKPFHGQNHDFPEPKGVIRNSLGVPEGEELVVADSSQIEARVLAWVSQHFSLIEAFKRNDAKTAAWLASGKTVGEEGDIYSEFGTESVFMRPISKKDTPTERQISKNLLLGCGYSMGWKKFAGETLKGMLGSKPVQFTMDDANKFGVDVQAFFNRYGEDVQEMHDFMAGRIEFDDLVVHCAVATYLIGLYRVRNTPITGFWKHMETVLSAMAAGSEYHFGPGNCLKTVRHGIVLPNGMVMRYPGLAHRDGSWGYLGGKSGKEWVRTYGGSITENIVQALAKIVVEEQMLWCRAKLGTHTVTCTHDEILSAVPRGRGEEVLKAKLEIMRTPPPWAPDLPLNAAGDYGDCYGELK